MHPHHAAIEILARNTQDRTTLATMLDRLRERVGLTEGSTIVLDRGMTYADNIAELVIRTQHEACLRADIDKLSQRIADKKLVKLDKSSRPFARASWAHLRPAHPRRERLP